MELAARIGTMARRGAPLPYLRRVAYLESSAKPSVWSEQLGPWIATGIWPYDGTKWILDFEWPKYDGSTINYINGTYSNGNRFDIGIRPQIDGIAGAIQLNVISSLNGSFVGDNHVTAFIDVPNQTAGVNDLTYSVSGRYTRNTGYYSQIFLFGRGNNSLVGYQGGRIYRSIIYDYGDLIQDLIPVVDLSGRPCMYNQVPISVPVDDPSRFFYNQGTGEFTWGELDASSALVSSRGWGGVGAGLNA